MLRAVANNIATGESFAFTDNSGAPGNNTANTPSGRCAIAAAAASVVVTNSLAKATSRVGCVINQAGADGTLTAVPRVLTAPGSFTIFGNAAATANVVVDWVLYP